MKLLISGILIGIALGVMIGYRVTVWVVQEMIKDGRMIYRGGGRNR